VDQLREAVVAGQFYPASAAELKRQLSSFLDRGQEKGEAIACILPHAGYVYSGRVAAQTLNCVKIKSKIVLLGPNHTGMGEPFSIMTAGIWQTPLGGVKIDSGLARLILGRSKLLREDSLAHAQEHSLEVELPIIQYFRDDFEIVPIALLSDDLTRLKQVGRDIASAIQESGPPDAVMLLASSDMTHYESQESAQEKDSAAIEAILELNEDKLFQIIHSLRISMCGYAPVAAMIEASKQLGATRARLIKYETSAAASRDTSSVVGYAGIIIS
jgi:AmmeMemoRadiSam system protein B